MCRKRSCRGKKTYNLSECLWRIGWLVGFNGLSIVVAYLMPNSVFAYVKPYIFKLMT